MLVFIAGEVAADVGDGQLAVGNNCNFLRPLQSAFNDFSRKHNTRFRLRVVEWNAAFAQVLLPVLELAETCVAVACGGAKGLARTQLQKTKWSRPNRTIVAEL